MAERRLSNHRYCAVMLRYVSTDYRYLDYHVVDFTRLSGTDATLYDVDTEPGVEITSLSWVLPACLCDVRCT